ncbi:Fasciclin-like arabinogalactan protein [Quillaja saponaria]|uniref:Fasciclin-like arabinogalactan protein n=1 Tax=Quillaja saponaria TaxID=32244 RepID=A0AAD7P5P8_QUISA|nr:Fasciclin-like arabinogalactan protein [Quillaja saponaria]
MFSGNFLIVTSSASDGRISLNNVRISAAPIYDDGIFIIFGIERFLNPNSQFPATIPTPTHHFFCGVKNDTTVFFGDNSFNQARETLRSGGYTTMASFLGMQLSGIMGENVMTVFAPEDEAMVTRLGNFIEYPSIFLRHVVPCKLLWNDLVNFDDGTELPTYLEGFKIRITRSGGILMLNDVQVFFPDMYYSDKLVVHGVRQVFEEHGRPQEAEGTFPQMGGTVAQENVFNPGDF